MNTQPKKRNTPILKLHRNTQEAKKVSVDDGFTAMPNELLEAILKSGVLGWKGSYLLATVLKTLRWHKESDWFSHSQVCEMMGIEASKYHINQLSAARTELLKAKILFEDGKKTGVNLTVFEWSMVAPDKVGKSRKSRENTPENLGSGYPEKVGNTKETITKEKINNTPLPPEGEKTGGVSQEIETQAKSLLDYYNQLSQGACRDAKPFITLLTKTTSREAYSPDDIKLVIRWVLKVWSRRSGRPAKPANICRVNRFDGYLSDAIAWERSRNLVDCAEVVDAYNEALADRLGEFELDDAAEKQILTLLDHLKEKSVEGFRAYFQAFADNARPHYFGKNASGWKADFGFLMKPETLVNTRRGASGGR